MRMGLVPVLVCGAVACATPHKTAEQRQADAATVEQVQAALSADRTLYARHITVYADNGVVTLSGYVWTPEELAMAREDVEAVPGVTKVVNRIEVDRGAINNSSVTR
jgi:osmotically-inducible protein OsmY